MTVPGNLSSPLLATAADAAAAAVATKSLRFNSGDSPYLARTPSSAGNRKTWTWSGWLKVTEFPSAQCVFFGAKGSSGNANVSLDFNTAALRIVFWNGSGTDAILTTTQVFRDPSAWYHVVYAVDTTQATSANRVKIYVNGAQVTDFSTENYPSQNYETFVNNNTEHNIGRNVGNSSAFYRGYLADIYMVDGSQLEPTSFGAYDANGVWQAAAYSGTFGTNGFHLDFADSSDLGDDNSGNGNDFTPNNLSGTGAATSSAAVLNLPLNSTPFTDSSASSATVTNTGSVSTASAGTNSFNISNAASLNGSSQRLTTNNNNISFQGSWTIDVYFKIDSGASNSQGLFNSGYGSQTSHYMYIAIDSSDRPFIETSSSGSRSTASAISKNVWYHMRVIQKSGTITMYINGTSVVTHTAQTTDLSTAGSRTIGSLLDNSNNANNFDGLVGPFRIINDALDAPSSGGEATSSGTLANTGTKTVASEIDSLFDVPTNGDQTDSGAGGEVSGNHCCLNPLANSGMTLSNGNLDFTSDASNRDTCISTMAVSSGKWYWEVTVTGLGALIGIEPDDHYPAAGDRTGLQSAGYAWRLDDGFKFSNNGTSASFNSGTSVNDVIGVALDLDGGTLKFYRNGSLVGTAFTGVFGTYLPSIGDGSNTVAASGSVNFGQREWAYSAPSNHKALNTANLPTPTIADGSDYFEAKLYTGNGANSRTISGLGFSPDFLWVKDRGNTAGDFSHRLMDAVRGAGLSLSSNSTAAERDSSAQPGGGVETFTSDGFTIEQGTSNNNNQNNNNSAYVAWAWDAGSSNTSVSVGDLNSSAYNQDQTWSTYGSVTAGTFSPTIAALFDNDVSTGPSTGANTTATWTFTAAVTATTSIHIYAVNGSGPSGTQASNTEIRLTVDGVVHAIDGAPGLINTGLKGDLTAITINVGQSGSPGLRYIKVDDEELVDSGITVANVPTIASTVRAKASAGFSIVSYTGSGTAGDTIGHSLNAVPELILLKSRDTQTTNQSWTVHHSAIPATKNLILNDTAAAGTTGSWNDTAPDSSVFTVGSAQVVNTSGKKYIAYCFAPVAGYSSALSWEGNGSSDGVFIHTGFRVAWFLWKRSNGTANWYIYDSTRSTINVVNDNLEPNTSDAENTLTSMNVDFLSNGIKVRGSDGDINGSGGDYIGFALAENPFQANGGLAR